MNSQVFLCHFFVGYLANEQTNCLMLSNHRHTWTHVTPEVSQLRCRHLRDGEGDTGGVLFHTGFL